jgi:hypothetical protein
MEDLRNLLIDNNFPSHIIENEFKRFEKYKQPNVEKNPNPDEKTKYLYLPFINDKSETIGRKMQQTVSEYFPNVSLIVFSNVSIKSLAVNLFLKTNGISIADEKSS